MTKSRDGFGGMLCEGFDLNECASTRYPDGFSFSGWLFRGSGVCRHGAMR